MNKQTANDIGWLYDPMLDSKGKLVCPGYTWNPIKGCSPKSEGCDHCYARAIAERFGRPWNGPTFHKALLDEPRKVRTPSRIFVCSIADLFHEKLDVSEILQVFAAMMGAPQHTYILLTKRADLMQLFFHTQDAPENWWLGVTCENQARADERIPILLRCRSRNLFVSVEPMLGPVDVSAYTSTLGPRIEWVIAGPENGAGARECDPKWIADLAAQCQRENVSFFDKRPLSITQENPT